MSNKGEKKKIKALNAPKAVKLKRKEQAWTIRTRAGAHKLNDSVSLGMVLRNYLGLAGTMREAKTILLAGDIKINGRIRKDYRLGVGLFDTISIEKQKKNYRVIFDKKRRIQLKELEKNSNEKISKVVSKKATRKGVQITTNDGRIFINDKAKVGDSLKIKDPEGKIEEILEMKEGALAYITKGTHCSEKGKIKEIVKGTAKREKLVKIIQDENEFETIAENIMVIGEKEEAIGDLKKI